MIRRYFVTENFLDDKPETNEVTGEVYAHYEVIRAYDHDKAMRDAVRLAEHLINHPYKMKKIDSKYKNKVAIQRDPEIYQMAQQFLATHGRGQEEG